MISVTFYVISKRVNSTALPASSGTTYNGSLIDSTSLLSPSIRVNDAAMQTGSSVPAYNYAQFAGRYYWVTNWTYTSAGWIAEMTVDVLATYRTEIGASTQYVMRSSAEQNGYVVDTMWPVTADYSTQQQTAAGDAWWDVTAGSGAYVVGITGMASGSPDIDTGMISYWAMSPEAFGDFRSALFDSSLSIYKQTGSFGDISDDIVRMLADPFQYVVSCVWIPIMPSGTSSSGFSIGFWQFTTENTMVQISPFTSLFRTATITLPKHPLASDRGVYMSGAPFSKYSLNIPGIGYLSLDGSIIADAQRVTVVLSADAISGTAKVTVAAETTESSGTRSSSLYELQGCVGVPINLSRATMGANIVGGVFDMVAAAATASPSGIINAAVDSVSQFQPSISTIGNNGSFNYLRGLVYINATFFVPADDNNSHRGRPLMEERQLSSLGGYILCQDGEISIAGATRSELDSINSYLTGGFFYE